ncbi:hypothetical protein Tco_0003716 [Tanacetum coccineum]
MGAKPVKYLIEASSGIHFSGFPLNEVIPNNFYPRVADSQDTQTTIPQNDAFQTVDLDTYDSDCDDLSSAKAVLIANLLSYGLDVLSEVPHSKNFQNDMANKSVQEMQIRLIRKRKTVNKSLTAKLERYKIKTFEQILNIDLSSHEKLIDSQMDDMIWDRNALKQEINSLKQTLSKHVKEKESLLQTFTVFKKGSKEKENKYMDKEIILENKIKELDNIVYKVGQSAQTVHMLSKPQVFYDDTHKQALGYQNPFYLKKAQRIKPTLYDGSVISKKHDVIFVVDKEETLILEEGSQSKMLAKQNNLILKEKKINISSINYSELHKLAEDFGKRFVPQKELSADKLSSYMKNNQITYMKRERHVVLEREWLDKHFRERKKHERKLVLCV